MYDVIEAYLRSRYQGKYITCEFCYDAPTGSHQVSPQDDSVTRSGTVKYISTSAFYGIALAMVTFTDDTSIMLTYETQVTVSRRKK